MADAVLRLYLTALETAALLALPVVGIIAAVGVVVGLLQTITGIADQNLSFGPKIAAVVLLAALGGSTALALLAALLRASIHALPALAH